MGKETPVVIHWGVAWSNVAVMGGPAPVAVGLEASCRTNFRKGVKVRHPRSTVSIKLRQFAASRRPPGTALYTTDVRLCPSRSSGMGRPVFLFSLDGALRCGCERYVQYRCTVLSRCVYSNFICCAPRHCGTTRILSLIYFEYPYWGYSKYSVDYTRFLSLLQRDPSI